MTPLPYSKLNGDKILIGQNRKTLAYNYKKPFRGNSAVVDTNILNPRDQHHHHHHHQQRDRDQRDRDHRDHDDHVFT